MNRISIIQKSSDTIYITDDKDTREDLVSKLSSLYSINNIAVIKTNNTSVIIRPSDISSIIVEEILIKNAKEDKISPPQKKDNHIDIITDAN